MFQTERPDFLNQLKFSISKLSEFLKIVLNHRHELKFGRYLLVLGTKNGTEKPKKNKYAGGGLLKKNRVQVLV